MRVVFQVSIARPAIDGRYNLVILKRRRSKPFELVYEAVIVTLYLENSRSSHLFTEDNLANLVTRSGVVVKVDLSTLFGHDTQEPCGC